LIEKAVDLDHRVYVRVASASDAARLDDLLWTHNDRSFLAHQIWTGAESTHALIKVLVGEIPPPASHRQLLVNFSGALPEELETYERIAEIVDTDAERKRLSRERYKQYRERGCALETHNL
jgi:DNA polymerase-3 subunit chi